MRESGTATVTRKVGVKKPYIARTHRSLDDHDEGGAINRDKGTGNERAGSKSGAVPGEQHGSLGFLGVVLAAKESRKPGKQPGRQPSRWDRFLATGDIN